MKYNFYKELREHMGRVYRKVSGHSKKKMKRMGDPIEAAMKIFFEMPGAGMTLDAAILSDEEDYIFHGRRVYVPQNSDLVHMLWRSKMDVELADLDEFPRCFSVAWPKDTVIEGVELPGCLVWFGQQKERDLVVSKMEKWMGGPVRSVQGDRHQNEPDEYGFHLVYSEGNGVEKWFVRASIPQTWISECLKSEDDLKQKLGGYNAERILTHDLSPEDQHKQYVVIRSVINLMVYASACPESILFGWPEDFGLSSETKNRKPITLASPLQKIARTGGSHASPEPHFRNPHFRRYPLRNGKRKQGIVFVSGCLVNADIDPKTVVKR